MALAAGTKLGPYEVQSAIGAGGMGEVYRARDTRLDRTVAIKTLPASVASNPELRERFEREAKLISSLEHPHICALYDVGEHDTTHFLVMQYLEGETVAERLRRGPLPLDQALRHAIEIADALHRAHQQGIVHRDLKPGNVMLTKSGAKLLDFGLAKLHTVTSVPGAGRSAMPTQEQSITAQGTILGTLQYMAPEQLEGREADARTDIFALGAVLYEMVTGRKAFEGASQAALISAIMSANPPPIAERQPLVPPALERVIRLCLARDPEDRFDTTHDLLLQLKWIEEGGSQAGVAAPVVARRRTRERIAWITAAAAATAAAGFAGLYVTTPTSVPRPVRFTLAASGTGYTGAFGAVPSPNSRELVFVAGGADQRPRIYVRGLDMSQARPIDGTTGAQPFLFWSPDSRFIGFFADRKLKKVAVAGGPPQVISDVSVPAYGASWSSDGTILYGAEASGLYRVSAEGGTSEAVTTLDAGKHEIGHAWPYFLPDGRRFLYLMVGRPPDARADTHVLYVGSLDSKERTRLMAGVSRAEYVAPGHLVYIRDGTLLASPFDAGRGQITGEPMPIAEGVDYFRPTGEAGFRTSPGVLTFTTAVQPLHQLVWVDRSGKRVGAVSAVGSSDMVRLSPDGRHVAVGLTDPGSGVDLWVYGVDRETATRLTFDPRWESFPVWSPDGSRLAFASDHDGLSDIYVMMVDGSGRQEVLVRAEGNQVPSDWSLDGRFLMYWSNADVWILPMTGDRKPFAFITTPFAEHSPRFSPDARWVAYSSDETGSSQVYVRAFPGSGAKAQISTRGGGDPRWRRDGRELYFQNERQMFAVSFDTATGQAGEPQLLFELPNTPLAYDVAPDGARFLIQLEAEGGTQPSTTVLLDWLEGIRR